MTCASNIRHTSILKRQELLLKVLHTLGKPLLLLLATAIIFGSAALTFGFFASQLELHNTDDIRIKGRDIVRPKFENFKEQLHPLRDWAENTSKKWHIKNEQDIKERPIIKELSKILRAKDST